MTVAVTVGNYWSGIKTNYFRVKDEESFIDYLNRVAIEDGDIDVTQQLDSNGHMTYSFTTHGMILGIYEDDETEESGLVESDEGEYAAFIDGLQEIVAEDDAIIILEVGDDGHMMYAYATIVTEYDVDFLDLYDVASEKAFNMLSGFGLIRH